MAFPMPDDPYHKPVYHAAPHDLGRVKIQVRQNCLLIHNLIWCTWIYWYNLPPTIIDLPYYWWYTLSKIFYLNFLIIEKYKILPSQIEETRFTTLCSNNQTNQKVLSWTILSSWAFIPSWAFLSPCAYLSWGNLSSWTRLPWCSSWPCKNSGIFYLR